MKEAPSKGLLRASFVKRLSKQLFGSRTRPASVSHSAHSLHTHCESLHRALQSARDTVWKLSEECNEISNSANAAKVLNELATQFEEDIRFDGIRIIVSVRDMYLSVGGSGDGYHLQFEVPEVVKEYIEWRGDVVALQQAIHAEEARLHEEKEIVVQPVVHTKVARDASGGIRPRL